MAEKFCRPCPMEEAGFLRSKVLCRDHFLPTDFVTRGGIHPNLSAVTLGLDSASHSNPQSSPPLLPTLSNPQPSAVSPQNSKYFFLESCGAASDEHGEHLHQDISAMEKRYQGKWKCAVLANYYWTLARHATPCHGIRATGKRKKELCDFVCVK